MSSLPYRPCVGLALFNSDGKVFVGERIDSPGAWQMPQGGIDAGEDIHTAAFRELQEEIGTKSADILEISPELLRYEFPPDLPNAYLRENFRGQEQNWVALRYTGKDSDINLNAHEPAEFKAWQWVDLDHIVDLIVPFKRDLYRQVVTRFSKYKTAL
jgi:putative (di)nucleoside polyphosphate hydrolase